MSDFEPSIFLFTYVLVLRSDIDRYMAVSPIQIRFPIPQFSITLLVSNNPKTGTYITIRTRAEKGTKRAHLSTVLHKP